MTNSEPEQPVEPSSESEPGTIQQKTTQEVAKDLPWWAWCIIVGGICAVFIALCLFIIHKESNPTDTVVKTPNPGSHGARSPAVTQRMQVANNKIPMR